MASWGEFAKVSPELAGFGEKQFGVGIAYLATVRCDGSPRVHPVTPVVEDGHLLLRMEPTSPKGPDLRRDGRFALHSTVTDPDGECREFAGRGYAREVDDPSIRSLAPPDGTYTVLFELFVQSVLKTVHPQGKPVRERWVEGK